MSANDALLLIGHGSLRYPDASNIMRRHADLLRGSRHYSNVEIAALNGAPSVADALARIAAARIKVVPFFMEDGYFSRVAVPRAINAVLTQRDLHTSPAGRDATSRSMVSRPIETHDTNTVMTIRQAGALDDDRHRSSRIILCAPVGVHGGMAGVIERQALHAADAIGVPSQVAAVVIVGHGSAAAPGRALALHRHALRVGSTGLFARVEAACLEEAPFVAETLFMLREHPVVVIGFFANQGGHVRDDVPALITGEQTARGSSGPAVRFHDCVTNDPAMTRIIMDQAMNNTVEEK